MCDGLMDTFFAPAERLSFDELTELRATFLSLDAAKKMLDAIPDLAAVLSSTRQIIAVNNTLIRKFGVDNPEELVGMRPGELVGCIHAHEMPAGCGTASPCASCDALQTVLDAIKTHEFAARDCRLQTFGESNGGVLDLHVEAIPVLFGKRYFFVISMRDISGQKPETVPGILPNAETEGSRQIRIQNVKSFVRSILGDTPFTLGTPIIIRL